MESRVVLLLTFIVACAYAQVSLPPGYKEKYPEYYKFSKQARHPRDVTWDKNVGGGKVFGTLGSNDQGLFGKGGYQKEVFNDHRGKLDGQAYGTRVLGANGGSSHLGGRLDWSDSNAKAHVDVSKQIGGRTSLSAAGGGKWNLDRNTELSASGTYSQQQLGHGRPDVGVQAEIKHNF